MPFSPHYRGSAAFMALGDTTGAPFYDHVQAATFPRHIVRYKNSHWAGRVGLDRLTEAEWIAHFGRFEPLPGSLSQPAAIRYHGHQFRSYNPDIGDGRGFLQAQLYDDQGRLLDLATKGSGTTPYSRAGDGRLTLKGGVREILATEMLEALGVETSKSFSLIETGERLERGDEPSPTRSSVLVRLGHSHIRFGAFQRLSAENRADALNDLTEYCCTHFYPHIKTGAARVTDFFREVVARSARLCAQWMAAGFVHGVLNTDNMNITGESFDYGPWRFLPAVDFGFTAAYFDQTGLYAYGRQPDAVAWNLAQLGGALRLLASEDELNAALKTFSGAFERAMIDAFHQRLGLAPSGAGDFDFIMSLLRWMDDRSVPFERVFFDWFCGSASANRAAKSPLAAAYQDPSFAELEKQLRARSPVGAERLADAYFDGIPCTMIVDEVEALWRAIAQDDDWSPINQKLGHIRTMKSAYEMP